MKTKIITILFMIFLLLLINAWFYKCHSMAREDYDKLHYGIHFVAHQGLTNILHVSNTNAALICFGAGYFNELFDEMSKQGFFDKQGVFFDPYYGFDKYDICRNCTGIAASCTLNLLLPENIHARSIQITHNMIYLSFSINLH